MSASRAERLPEALFYQLERRNLEGALPDLLARSLARGWRAVVQVGSEERLQALNAHLWSYDDASFLPHGSAADGNAEEQPIWLTTGDDNPNGAAVRFLVEGADSTALAEYERFVYLFSAADESGAATARAAWRRWRAAGAAATFWREGEGGRWTKQADAQRQSTGSAAS